MRRRHEIICRGVMLSASLALGAALQALVQAVSIKPRRMPPYASCYGRPAPARCTARVRYVRFLPRAVRRRLTATATRTSVRRAYSNDWQSPTYDTSRPIDYGAAAAPAAQAALAQAVRDQTNNVMQMTATPAATDAQMALDNQNMTERSRAPASATASRDPLGGIGLICFGPATKACRPFRGIATKTVARPTGLEPVLPP